METLKAMTLLGLTIDDGWPDEAAVKAAHREKIKSCHPDVNSGRKSMNVAAARINEAFETLKTAAPMLVVDARTAHLPDRTFGAWMDGELCAELKVIDEDHLAEMIRLKEVALRMVARNQKRWMAIPTEIFFFRASRDRGGWFAMVRTENMKDVKLF